ncbi:sulfotransferase family protein [Catenulispora rubra]|uniref:sulfotransferase family protein n=1 Tax=Catenulispora rubra TaxID=280293 RepID=UPI002B274B83|nr:sulfotransferase [Catenulispora rubra]
MRWSRKVAKVNGGASSGMSRGPVFVLCSARSGSTLLRFILDSHPALTCPPEVGPGRTCASLLQLIDTLAGRADSERKNEAESSTVSTIDRGAAETIRRVIDGQYGDYARRHGKGRWCDKSLDNAAFGSLLAQVFPDAKFICLYRQCMDVIDSGLEASPWGLSSFGFAPHAAEFPGNSVAAIGHYWLFTTQTIREFEESHRERCMRVRYEDLVSDPELIANSVFNFLGESPISGIADLCLNTEHDSHGAGDQKIWFTDKISTASVGRGERVPVMAIPPPLLDGINLVLTDLGYPQVGHRGEGESGHGSDATPSPDLEVAAAIRDRLVTSSEAKRADVLRRWPTLRAADITIKIGETWAESAAITWRFPSEEQNLADSESISDTPETKLRVLASAAVWRALLAGESNLAIDLVAGRVRCDFADERTQLREPALLALCVLLGIARIGAIPESDLVAYQPPSTVANGGKLTPK